MRGGLGGFWHWDHHGFMGFSWLRLNGRNTQQPLVLLLIRPPPAEPGATPAVTRQALGISIQL